MSLLKRQSPPFSQRAANILPPINASVSMATWSRFCRANASAAGRKVAGCGGAWWGTGTGTFFQGANYTLIGTDGNIQLGLFLQLKATFLAVETDFQSRPLLIGLVKPRQGKNIQPQTPT